MKLNYKPDVILISQSYFVQHSQPENITIDKAHIFATARTNDVMSFATLNVSIVLQILRRHSSILCNLNNHMHFLLDLFDLRSMYFIPLT